MSSKGKFVSVKGVSVRASKIKPVSAHCLKKNAGGKTLAEDVLDKSRLEPAATVGLIFDRSNLRNLLGKLQEALFYADQHDQDHIEIAAYRDTSFVSVLVPRG